MKVTAGLALTAVNFAFGFALSAVDFLFGNTTVAVIFVYGLRVLLSKCGTVTSGGAAVGARPRHTPSVAAWQVRLAAGDAPGCALGRTGGLRARGARWRLLLPGCLDVSDR